MLIRTARIWHLEKNYGISWRKLVSPMVACNNQQASPLHEKNIGGWQAQEDTTMKLIYFDAIMEEMWTYKMKCIPSTTSLRRELVRKPQPPKEFEKMKIWCPVKESYHRTISDELQVAQQKYVKKIIWAQDALCLLNSPFHQVSEAPHQPIEGFGHQGLQFSFAPYT